MIYDLGMLRKAASYRFLFLLISASRLGAADADLVLRGGKVITLDARNAVVEAVAFAGGRVVALGPAAAAMPAKRVVELHGGTVLPGLTDAHVHALEAGLSE